VALRRVLGRVRLRLGPAARNAQQQDRDDRARELVDYFSLEFKRVGAAAAMIALPILVIFLIGQRYFTHGLMQGAIKG
jgi:ABC-type glycerol-3-phosphate transport system permease component